MDFNSSLLKPMPRPTPRRKRKIRPGFLLLLFGTLIVAPIAMIAFQTLYPVGFGYYLYWIHDHIFLPIKGYTYTLFHPWALLFWGPLLFMVIMWVVSYLRSDSIFNRLQVFLSRKAVRRRFLHSILLKAARVLKKSRIEPFLLSAVALEQRQKALSQLISVPSSDSSRPVVAPAVTLTSFHNQLLTLPPVQTVRHLEALVSWLEVYIRLKRRLKINPDLKRVEKLVLQMDGEIDDLVLPIFNYKDPLWLGEVRERAIGFDVFTLLLDILYIVCLSNDQLAGSILGGDIPKKQRERDVALRLVNSVAARRLLMDRSRILLEDSQSKYGGMFLVDDVDNLPYIGKLSLLVALEASEVSGILDIGLGYIESLEAFDFVLYQYQPEIKKGDDKTLSNLQRMALLVRGTPEESDYRFLGELVDMETKRTKEEWMRLGDTRNNIIKPGDFDLAESRAQSLFQAAGPE